MHLNKFYFFKLLTNGAKNFWPFLFLFFFWKIRKKDYLNFKKAKIKEAKI